MGTLGKAIYTVGFWIRETGQALDRLGCRFQGKYYFQEQRTLFPTLSFAIFSNNIFANNTYIHTQISINIVSFFYGF